MERCLRTPTVAAVRENRRTLNVEKFRSEWIAS
jgi:hypothetical protein